MLVHVPMLAAFVRTNIARLNTGMELRMQEFTVGFSLPGKNAHRRGANIGAV
jgi:hypothetical protein